MFKSLKENDEMKLLTIVAALLAAFAVGGGIALATGSGSTPQGNLTSSTVETGTTTGEEPGEISGPCDEAEHANDPRCTGVQVPGAGDGDDDDGPGDISGPCDEAEHANDPRCTGGATNDSSGPGPGGGDEDNSGPSDNSGPGSGDDDDDDNSGSGSSGSGSSGSGSSGSGSGSGGSG
jgi:hypothetical protein